MEFIINNWYFIVAALAAVALAVIAVVPIIKMDGDARRAWLSKKLWPKLTQWLLTAVIGAEDMLGSGTGQYKLQLVYGQFCQKFPWLSTILPFATFSKLVDDALNKMEKILTGE